MSSLAYAIAVQASPDQTPSSYAPAAAYFVIGLIAVVVALVVFVFIRANARRAPKG
jgi:RsiW-degrading membrane proteinase PrsW (M82 family)